MNLDTWTAKKTLTTATRTMPASPVSYSDVAFGVVAGKSAFVAVGPEVVATSLDGGATWTATRKALETYSGVAFGNGMFVAVGGHRTSWDGVTWATAQSQQVGGITNVLRAIAFGGRRQGGLFVAVGDSGTIKTTSDGVSWTTATSGISDGLQAIAYGKRRFVAAAGSQILTSPDGVTWTKQVTTGIVNKIQTLTFGDGRFLGVDNGLRVVTSLDGVSWTTTAGTVPTLGAQVNGIVYAFDTWVVADSAGSVYTSPTGGAPWTKRPYPVIAAAQLGGIAYGTNRCVTVAADGQVVRSEEYPNAELLALTCSTGQVTPSLDPARLAYYAELTEAFASVTPTGQDGATIKVRFDAGADAAVASGTASAVSQLGGRSREFSITLRARNGFTRIYTLGVSQKPVALRVPDPLRPPP